MGKRKQAKEKGYDSYLEMELHRGPLKDADYHPDTIEYLVPAHYANYTPDFRVGRFLIEAKGFFRKGDPKKYKDINTALKDTNEKLVFIFENPKTKMPGARRRKDGSYLTMGEWASNLDIPWFDKTNCKDIFNLQENENVSTKK